MSTPMETREILNMVLSKYGVPTSRFVRKLTDIICSKDSLFIYLRDNGTDTTGISYRKDKEEYVQDLSITLYLVNRNGQILFQVKLSTIDGVQTHSELNLINDQSIDQIDLMLESVFTEHTNNRNHLFRRLSNSLEKIITT
jgi:hypothetical protein